MIRALQGQERLLRLNIEPDKFLPGRDAPVTNEIHSLINTKGCFPADLLQLTEPTR